MALDDFDDDDDILDLEEGSEDEVAEFDSPDEDESAELDEDLFDFPAPEEAREFDYSGHQARIYPGAQAAPEPEPVAPLPDETGGTRKDSAGDLLTTSGSTTGLPGGSNAANHDLSPLSTASPYYDAALDQDLYDFPDVFAGAHEVQSVQPASDLPPARPTDPLGLAMGMEPAHEKDPATESPEASVAAEHAAATGAGSAASAAAYSEDLFTDLGPAAYGPPPVLAPAISTTARGRLLEVLALAFLVVNTGLVLFAWQANSSFHDTLEAVTRTVSETLAAGSSGDPVVVRVPAEGPALVTLDDQPSAVSDYSIESLEAAREMLTSGRYMDARRRLYRLLASADVAGLDPRVTTEAEFLIAESYELQGRALAEEGR